MALTKGRENVSWGFRNPSNGWHTVAFQEGVQLRINENSGKESLQIPMIVDEGSEDDGCRVTAFINTRNENKEIYKGAEQQIADIITNAGLYDAFSSKFADVDSWLDTRVIEALKLKLMGKFVMVETRLGKDQNGNERCNVQGWAPQGTKKEKKVEAAAGGKKAAATSTPKAEW